MILNVVSAEYVKDFVLNIKFNTGESLIVDLEDTIMNDGRKIFKPLQSVTYFKTYSIRLNTICWENEADFAPEFLLELGYKQNITKMKAISSSSK